MLKCKKKSIWDILDDDTLQLAYGIVGESTGRGFERIRVKYNKIVPDNPLPSNYLLNKKLPASIIPFEHKLIEKSKKSVTSETKEKILFGILPKCDNVIKSEEDALQIFSKINQVDKDQQTEWTAAENPNLQEFSWFDHKAT